MKRILSVVALFGAAGVANADWTLQFDVNDIAIQAQDDDGFDSAFGGTSHTGSLDLGFEDGITDLEAIAAQFGNGNPFIDQNFTGTLTDFDGEIFLSGGVVTGGFLALTVDSGDTYTALITANSGLVGTDAQGRFTVTGLTYEGTFSDAMFGNVDVSEWFDGQGGAGLFGDFIEFKFDPNASGSGFGDMDIFVVVPLPPAAYAGLAGLAGVAGMGFIRRRK